MVIYLKTYFGCQNIFRKSEISNISSVAIFISNRASTSDIVMKAN